MKAAFAKTSATAIAITLAFAAPATLLVLRGALPASESRLGNAIASAFGGITFPLLAAAIAISVFASGTRPRAHLDRLVAAGGDPQKVVLPVLGMSFGAAIVGAAIAGMLTVALLRAILHLPAYLFADLFGTAWANALGAAAWTSLAIAFVIGTGRSSRAFIVVAIDLVTRLLPGGVSWLAPSAHVRNVLGAPPSRGFLHVPVLPQLASVAFLLVLAALGGLASMRRYRGAPRF